MEYNIKDREIFKRWLILTPDRACSCGSRHIVYIGTSEDDFSNMVALCKTCDKVWKVLISKRSRLNV